MNLAGMQFAGFPSIFYLGEVEWLKLLSLSLSLSSLSLSLCVCVSVCLSISLQISRNILKKRKINEKGKLLYLFVVHRGNIEVYVHGTPSHNRQGNCPLAIAKRCFYFKNTS